ncbi:MAG: restriction endonuclease [Solobacterium sp.]|nr:restriction endonuclease [Solobacterium sp.]MCH4205135.1 restriction endonuclease [Solobacterium sp.]MCH4226728.1 restriction endonuclease [Solobacterium sp.]MCH4281943.1 restriction endonuclease [Solobacterium sp.]
MKKVTTGIEYEKWCASYLKKHGFHQISLTKATGDQGIDIIAYQGRMKYGIQCKFYDSPVGNSSVQEAYAGAAFYVCDKALVMTNTEFTKGAAALAQETGVLLWPKKDPARGDRFLRSYRFLRLLEGIIGAVLFMLVICRHDLYGRDDISFCAVLLMMGSCIGMFSDSWLALNLFSDLTDVLIAVLMVKLMAAGIFSAVFPWWIGNVLLLLFAAVQLIVLCRDRTAYIKEQKQKRLEEERKVQALADAQKLSEVLQNELHCHLDLTACRKDGEIPVFCYHADQNISALLASAELSLNQSSTQDHQNMYRLLDLGRRRFQVSVHPSETKN